MADAGPMARFRALIEDATLMDQVVQRIAEDGETLKSLAKNWKVPYGSLAQWVIEDRERSEQYSRALRFAAETFVHDIVPIADNKHPDALQDPAGRKLQFEARKYVASKWDKQRYGDQQHVTHSGQFSLVSVLARLPKTGLVVDAEPVLEVVGEVTPAEKISEKISQQLEPI